MKDSKVIVVRETVRESIIKDCITIALFGGMIGVGVILDSNAMQWVGALAAFLTTATLAIRSATGTNKFTIEQARAKLDEWEAGE